MPQRRTFDKAYKLSVVELKLSGKVKTSTICEIYDLDRQTLHRWVKEYKELGKDAFLSNGVNPGEDVARTNKENETLRIENEILKKAAAYFAKRKQK